jgi:hypothetical protein
MDKKDRQYTYQRNTGARWRNKFFRGKVLSVTYSECVSVALDIQVAKNMHRIIWSSVACLNVPYSFHIISYTARFSGKNC